MSDQLAATADLAETEVVRLRLGAPATALVNADTPAEVSAQVSTIAPTPDSAGDFAVGFSLSSTSPGARPGLTAWLRVVLAQSLRVLFVPTAAVIGTGGHLTVTVEDRGGRRRGVAVTAGLVGNGITAIVSSLHQGQEVVVPS